MSHGFDWVWLDILACAWNGMRSDRSRSGYRTPSWARLRARFVLEHPDLYGPHPTA